MIERFEIVTSFLTCYHPTEHCTAVVSELSVLDISMHAPFAGAKTLERMALQIMKVCPFCCSTVLTVIPLHCVCYRSSETTFIEVTAPSSATRDAAGGVSKKPPRSNGSVLNFKSLKEV